MARKEITITLGEEAGRDKDKAFHIKEMPASRAEEWAVKALLALAGSGDVPGLDPSMGVSGIAKVGIGALGGLTWEKAGPLYQELLTCVSLVSPDNPNVRIPLKPETVDSQVEEISTMVRLRMEVLKLHLGFLQGGDLLNFLKGNAAPASPNT